MPDTSPEDRYCPFKPSAPISGVVQPRPVLEVSRCANHCALFMENGKCALVVIAEATRTSSSGR